MEETLSPDLNTLVNVLVPFAKRMISRHGKFLPFGASVTTDGEISLNAGVPNAGASDADTVRSTLAAGLLADATAGAIRACALCENAELDPNDWDGYRSSIHVRFEDRNGMAMSVFIPYRKGILWGLKCGEMVVAPTTPQVFKSV